jgi:uncharacterized membrane protein YeiH
MITDTRTTTERITMRARATANRQSRTLLSWLVVLVSALLIVPIQSGTPALVQRRTTTTKMPTPQKSLATTTRRTAAPLLSSSSQAAIDSLRGGGYSSSKNPVSDFLYAVDLMGTGVFAFSGAVTAGKRGMDLLGMLIISTITAVGGGTVRDVVMDTGTVFWMRSPLYFEICLFVTLATYAFWPTLERKCGWKDSSVPICTADALGLAAFAVLGTQAGADQGLAPIMWMVSGGISATFGGITRDILCLQRPRVMYPQRTMYATPPLLGSALYTLLTTTATTTHVTQQQAASLSFLLTFFARIFAFGSPLRLPHWNV